MVLKFRRVSPGKFRLIATLIASFAFVVQPLYSLVDARVASAASANIDNVVFSPTTTTINANEEKTFQIHFRHGTTDEQLSSGAKVELSTSSVDGEFAVGLDAANPWTHTVTSRTAATNYTTFRYRDSAVGTPTLTAHVSGGGLGGSSYEATANWTVVPAPTTPAPSIVTLDTVKPVVKIESPAQGQYINTITTNGILSVKGSIADANPNYTNIQLVDAKGNSIALNTAYGAFSAGDTITTFNTKTLNLANGLYHVNVMAADGAGNVYNVQSEIGYIDFYLDNEKPTVNFVDPGTSANDSYVNKDFKVKFHVQDNMALKSANVSLYKADGNTWVANCYNNATPNGTEINDECTVKLGNLADGTYVLKAGGQDQAGLWTVNATRTIKVQRAVPAQATNIQAKFQYDNTNIDNGSYLNKTAKSGNNNLELIWTAPAGQVTGYQVQATFPDGTTGVGYGGPNTNAWLMYNGFGQHGNGAYAYRVVAANPNGISTPSDSFTLYYDTQSPVAQFTQAPDDNAYVNRNFHVEATASDNVALSSVGFDVRDGSSWKAGCVANTFTVDYSADHKTATLSCDINTSGLIDGSIYYVRVHAGDHAGYGSSDAVPLSIRHFTVDKTAPTGTFTYSNGNGKDVTADDVTVTLKTSEPIATLTDWTKGTDDMTFTRVYSENGKYSVTMEDRATNMTTLKYEVKRIDKIAPVITINGAHQNGLYSDPTVGYTIAEQSIRDITIDGTKYSQKTAPKTVTGEGSHTITVYDKAGNKGEVTFKIDSIAPIVTINTPLSAIHSGNPVSLTGTVMNDFNFLQVTLNGKDYQLPDIKVTGTTWTLDVPGADTATLIAGHNYPITVSATDAAGNQSENTLGSTTTLAVQNPSTAGGGINNDVATFGAPLPITPNQPQGALASATDGTQAGTNADSAILGTQTKKDASPASSTAVIAPSAHGWNIFGLAWYWWLLILAVVAAIIWWIVAAARRNRAEA